MVQMRGSKNFHQGGRVQVSLTKKLWQRFFFSPQLILQKSNGQFQRNLSFFKAPDGVQFFPGGVQLLIPYRNPFNLWFSRGGPDPLPPLWIRTWCSSHSFMVKATIHYLIWAWQTLIDRRMYHPFIVIYLIISVYYRNVRCFNRWQLYILFNNVSYFGWSLTNHWPRALFPIKHDCTFQPAHGYPLRVKIPSLMLYWEMTKIFNYHEIRYFITSDRRQSRRLWTIDERGSQIARIYNLSPVRQTNCNPKSLFLTVFDLRSSIASTFSIATYPVCVLIQWIRNQNNLKQELGVIYIFQSCFCWKKSLFPHRIVSNRKHS